MSIANVLQIPGKVYVGVTGLSESGGPVGGTYLGPVATIRWQARAPVAEITAEEFGGVVSDLVYGGENGTVTLFMRTFTSAVSTIFPCYVTGANQGPVLRADANSSVRAGSLLGVGLGATLLVMPDNPKTAPALLVRRAIPSVDQTVAAAFSAKPSDEWGIPLVWYTSPDSSGRQYEFGDVRDLTF